MDQLSKTRRGRLSALRPSRKRFDVLAQQLPIGVYQTDIAGRFVYVNERWSELTGLDPESAEGVSWASVVHPEDLERVVGEWRRSRLEERPFSLEYRYLRPDGSAAWISCRAVELRDDHGEVTGYLGTCSDTVVSPTVDKALEEAEERFANAFEEAPIGMALVGLDGSFLRVNRALPEIVGRDPEELLGLTFEDITHPDDLEADLELVRQVIAGELRSYRMEKRYVRADGEQRWVLLSVSLVRNETGEPLYFVSQIEDVTDRRRGEDALREAEDRFRSAFDEAPIGMAMNALDGRFLRVNRALSEITGHSREQLEATNFRSITHPDDLARNEKGMSDMLAGRAPHYRTEKRYIHANGHVVPVDLSCTVVRDADGEPLHILTQVQDITERKRFEGQLQYLADHDSLTGLFNRRRFEEELTRELAGAERYESRLAVLAIDLDDFKYINDSLGHSIGDELIARVGRGLRERLRRSDVLARLGGDEFAVILPRIDEATALELAEGLLEAVAEVDLVGLGGRGGGKVSASVGVAMFDAASRLTAEELLVEADIAMYDAKEAGRARAILYDATEDRQERMLSRMTWAERVRDALAADSFVLYAQPVMSLNGDPIPRSELLLRMLGENGDVIPPGSFLYIAERFDLVQEIDRWVVSRAIEILAEEQAADNEVVLCVNLSAKSVTDPALPEHVAHELQAHGADGRGLCFEVTETAAIVNVDRARHFASLVAELGCEFALDDFGAGFASFYYLKHLAFDLLKIDGEFVTDLTTSLTDQLVVKSVVDIARGLGKRTIAEFVEDAETLDLLRGMGVDFAQGFYVAKPAPLPLVQSPLPHLENA
ncbi:MAG: PAS domain S-box protein [Thermoleophilaceae bacterium]|nr:PAS domain S-box protein [Thermoleophilaceae bacterium]